MIHYLPTLIHFKVKKVNHETKLIKIDYIELIFKGIFDSTLLGVIRSSNRAFFSKNCHLELLCNEANYLHSCRHMCSFLA